MFLVKQVVFYPAAIRSPAHVSDVNISLQISSRGQLMSHGRYHTRGQVLISLIVPITKDMVPSFRIVAYYHTNDNEVVSDSVWVDVKDTCMGSVSLFKWVAYTEWSSNWRRGIKQRCLFNNAKVL